MSQIFLFTGENAYELSSKRRLWIQEFGSKYGAENVSVADGKTLVYKDFIDEAATMPFIAEKRLLVIDGIPKFTKEQVQELTKAIHPQVLVLFIDAKPDKRLGGTKEILKIAQTETFTPVRGSRLNAWIEQYAKQEGSSIAPKQVAELTSMVGEDQMLLASEIKKLAAFAGEKGIQSEDIEKLTMLSSEQVVWKLLDLLSARKTDEALEFTHTILKRGEDPFGLWGMFLWMVSRITNVAALAAEGAPAPVIAKECGMHPNSVHSVLKLAQSMDQQHLLRMVDTITQTDIDLRTGAYKHTAESPEELFALLDTRIAAVS